MLSSIHPLGERARHNRWAITVGSFTLASTVAGAGIGALLASVGTPLAGGWTTSASLSVVAAAVVVAGLLDWAGVEPPGPHRQVNETWIGFYRGVVYGGAFGAQLGLGVATYVVTWGVYATFTAELLAGSWSSGALIGAAFGLGRSIAPLLAGWIDRPSRLSRFHGRMSRLGPVVRTSATAATAAVGGLGLAALVL